MIMNLVKQDDPILKQKCESFDFDKPQVDPEKLALDLRETMVYNKGIGLSACQVGLPYRVFVAGDPGDIDNIKVFFNPRIVDASDEKVLIEEGCLSFPGLFMKVKRPATVRIRFADPRGVIDTQVYDGIPARAILHECDHMDGVLFHTRANPYHREQARKQKKKLDKLRAANKKKLSKI